MKKGIIAVAIVLGVGLVIGGVGLFLHLTEPDRDQVTIETEETTDGDIQYRVPESVNTEEMSAESNRKDQEYSDTTICATFSEDIRNYCVEAFGEYLPALQDTYKLVEGMGYRYFTAYTTDSEYTEVGENTLSFTLYLPGNRGRVTITKDGSTYSTSFRILDDSELVVMESEDSDEVETGEVVADTFTVNTTSAPAVEGYDTCPTDAELYVVDAETLNEAYDSAVIEQVLNSFGTVTPLSAPYVLLGEQDLHSASVSVADGSVQVAYNNYLVTVTGTDSYSVNFYIKRQ